MIKISHIFGAFVLMSLLYGVRGCLGDRQKTPDSLQRTEQLQAKKNIVPALILGSGPAGLMAAIYSARFGQQTWILEGPKSGGLLNETTEVENWPGEISILGPEIIAKLRQQAVSVGVHFLEDSATKINTSQWPFSVETDGGLQLHALSIIVATGASPKKKGVPGEEEYWGNGITTCAICDATFFKNEDVVVIGGGDSAIEESIQLAPYAQSITILVRKDQMRASQSMQSRLQKYDNISVRFNADVTEIEGDGEKITGVWLINPTTQERSHMPTSGVFLAIGHDPNTELFKSRNKGKNTLELTQDGHIKVFDRSQKTSVAGIFAAGDVADPDYRQAVVSAGDGCKAAIDAFRFLQEQNISLDALSLFQGETAEKNENHTHVPELSSLKELETIIKRSKNKVIVLDFFTQSCGPCKQFMPIFHAAAQRYAHQAYFAKVDAGTAEDIADHYAVHKVPLLVVLKDGVVEGRFAPVSKDGRGIISSSELDLYIRGFLQENAGIAE